MLQSPLNGRKVCSGSFLHVSLWCALAPILPILEREPNSQFLVRKHQKPKQSLNFQRVKGPVVFDVLCILCLNPYVKDVTCHFELFCIVCL